MSTTVNKYELPKWINTPIQRYIANAFALGHGSDVVASAAFLVGHKAHSLCCWCAEHVEGEAKRLPAGGECERCSYVGADCLVIIPDCGLAPQLSEQQPK